MSGLWTTNEEDKGSKARHVHSELSGTVVGPSVQAGAVHGGVHIQHVTTPTHVPVPRQLLAPPSNFTNRLAELHKLDSVLSDLASRPGPALLVLKGPGGVGKTTLALQWLHQLRDRFSDGELYTDLSSRGGQSPVDVGDVLGEFLRALGVEPRHVPVRLGERAALYRSVTAERRLVVLLDEAMSAAQVRTLRPASGHSLVVVTSRRVLRGLLADGARVVEVGPFDEGAAVDLLKRSLGPDRVAAEQEPAEALARLCGGLPIALCVVSAHLSARPRWRLGRIVRDLRDEHRRLATLSTEEDLSVGAVFDLSYRELSSAPARMYRLLGLHPGPTFGVEVAAAGANTSVAEARYQVEMLVDASLLTEVGDERYGFHELVRAHAAAQAETDESIEARETALRNMLEWYLHAARAAQGVLMPTRRIVSYRFQCSPELLVAPNQVADYNSALGWFELERINLTAAVRRAVQQALPELAWQIADAMRPLFLYRKHYRAAVEVDQLALDAAVEWGNAFAELSMLKRLGQTYLELGQVHEAERSIGRALRRAREQDDPRGIASALKRLALLCVENGRIEDAVEHFMSALRTYKALGRKRSEGLTLIDLGAALTALGRTSAAIEHLTLAQQVLGALDVPDPYNVARGLAFLGRAHGSAGNYDQAEKLLGQALTEMQRLKSDYEQAQTHAALGDLARDRGNLMTARQHYTQAEKVFDALESTHAQQIREKLQALDEVSS